MNTEEICRKCKNGELAYPDIKACEDNNRKSLERAQLYEKCGMYLDAFDFYEMACNDTDPYDYIKSVELLTHAAQLAHEHGYHSQEAHLYGHVGREYLYDANKIDRKQKKMRIMPAMDAIDKSVKASLEVPDVESAAKTCWMTADDYIGWRMAFERIIILYEKASGLAQELLASAKESFRKEYFLDMLIGIHYSAGAACKYLQDYKSTQNHWKISDEYTERLVVEFNREREKIKHGLEWIIINEDSTDMDISGLESIDTEKVREAFMRRTKNSFSNPVSLEEVYKTPSLAPNGVKYIYARVDDPLWDPGDMILRFSVEDGLGIVLPEYIKAKDDSAAFIPSGKTGSCRIKVELLLEEQTRLEEKYINIKIRNPQTATQPAPEPACSPSSCPSPQLLELRWTYPASIGLYKTEGTEPHWKSTGLKFNYRPPAFGKRLLGGKKNPLQIQLTLCLDPQQELLNMPRGLIKGRAIFKSPEKSSFVSSGTTVEFNGEAQNLGSESVKVIVKSTDTLPEDVGKYLVEIVWSFCPGNKPENQFMTFCTTKNYFYVTWKQPIPSVFCTHGVLYTATGYGTQLLQKVKTPDGERNYPLVYLKCLETSTKAVMAEGCLKDDYLPGKLPKKADIMYEVQILDRIFDHVIKSGAFEKYERRPWMIPSGLPSQPSQDHQSFDIISKGRGNCGDWACFFHDLAASQGISVCLGTIGKPALINAIKVSGGGENFCMYPDLGEDCNQNIPLLPVMYDLFIEMEKGSGIYGVRGTNPSDSFASGGWSNFKARISQVLGYKNVQTTFGHKYSPVLVRCGGCGEDGIPVGELKECPLCGYAL